MIKHDILKLVRKLGYSISKIDDGERMLKGEIRDAEFWELHALCKPYTMTFTDTMYALYGAVKYILANDIKGDFVECGVWRGGSAMMIAYMLSNRGISDRKIFLYDTFEGMSKPLEYDVDNQGRSAETLFNTYKQANVGWCIADLIDVQHNMRLTKYPDENIVYVKGKVEDTIPATMPGNISLLRLDTDFYESTMQELSFLYPLLSINGILIIDDYGHWEGCRKAIDEYFGKEHKSIFLNRINYSGRIGIKSR